MFYISSEKDIDIDQLMNLIKQTYWAPNRTKEAFIKAMEHSVNFGAFDEEGNLVGYARVVTDFVTIWYLCDVIVDEKYRGQGIGKMLMSAIISDKRFANASALLKTKDAHWLYSQFGFMNADSNRVMFRDRIN